MSCGNRWYQLYQVGLRLSVSGMIYMGFGERHAREQTTVGEALEGKFSIPCSDVTVNTSKPPDGLGRRSSDSYHVRELEPSIV